MMLLEPAASAPVLALVTTIHLAMAALRNHRSASGSISSLGVVSVLLAGLPWAFPAAAGLALGLGLHGVWFVICERLAPPPAPAPAPAPARSAPSPRPSGASGPQPPQAVKSFVPVAVLAVLDESSDIRTFRLARPVGFEFRAGQFLPIRVRTDGVEHVRCYSLSSAPAASGYLEISVKRQGLVSRVLHATLRPGALLHVKAPAGSFVYPADDDRPLILLAGGIGITPLLSMFRHAVHADPTRAITLLYSAQSEDDLAFRAEIETMARRYPQTRVVFAVTRGSAGPYAHPGRIDETLLRALDTDFAHAIACLCGPQAMIDGLRQTLAALGMPDASIRSERFDAVVAATAGRGNRTDQAAAGNANALHTVRCNGSAVQVPAGQTLLEASEAGGFPIESLCRSGVCGTCRTKVIEGEVDCASSLLDDEDRAAGYVLACVSEIRANCAIEAAT